MASSWIRKRETPGGQIRWLVGYRLGGREAKQKYAGSFKTKREAEARKKWVDGELAAQRPPDLTVLTAAEAPTLAEVAQAWAESRVDVRESTKVSHQVALGRLLPHLGKVRVDALTPAVISEWIGTLAGEGLSRSSIQKSRTALRLALDHHGVSPNPARDPRVKLPREEREEIEPPTAAQVEAVLGAVAPRYRLPILVLEATGMRIGELESVRWGDLDARESRWRVTRSSSKTKTGRWVQLPADLLAAIGELRPREDRDLEAPIFDYMTQARLRTEIQRACRATGTPLFSPHDLRHRRISLWHREGVPWADIGARVGQKSRAVTADVYSHVIVEGEVDRSRFNS